MRSVRSNRKPKRQNESAFRQDLRVGVTFIGEMPQQHRGQITDTLYVWNARHTSRWVDRRDLPGLIKELGVDNLDGEWIATFKEKKAERAKKKVAAVEEPQIEEVQNDL